MDGHLDSFCDEELAKMAQGGDRAAFEVLCNRHLPAVYSRLCTLLPTEAVDDVTQEVFVAAMRGLSRFRAKSLFRTWLAAIARHKVADYYRKVTRSPSTVPLEEGLRVRSEGWEEGVAVRIALRRLAVDYQEVLLLRFAEGLPFKRIAIVLEISLEATKSRYRRAVAALAQEMKMELEYPIDG
jgi:RNA polymerase sigma-70 factor (ECF subfamily)